MAYAIVILFGREFPVDGWGVGFGLAFPCGLVCCCASTALTNDVRIRSGCMTFAFNVDAVSGLRFQRVGVAHSLLMRSTTDFKPCVTYIKHGGNQLGTPQFQ